MIRRFLSIEKVFLAAAALILIYVLFVPPMVGLADSGDYHRLLYWFGLDYHGNDFALTKNLFVQRTFDWNPKIEAHYPSSAVPVLGAALLVNAVLVGRDVFDIRLLGLTYACGYLLALFLLTKYTRTLSLGNRLVMYLLITLIFLDVGYIAYFNSFFSEPASLVFLAATLACALIAVSRERSSRRGWLSVAGFFACAFLFATAKAQNALTSVPLAIVGYSLVRTMGSPGDAGARRRKIAGVALACAFAVGLLGFSVVYSKVSRNVQRDALFLNVFHDILPRSSSPAADLAELGLDPALATYAGGPTSSPILPYSMRNIVVGKVGYAKILRFYAHHPDRLLSMAEEAGEGAFLLRPTYLGNYERWYVLEGGVEPVQRSMYLPSDYLTGKFALWSSLKEVLPKSLWIICVFLLVNIGAVVIKWLRFDASTKDRTVTQIHAVLIPMAALQFFTVVIGGGFEDVLKHLFLFNLLCEACLVFLVMYAVNVKAILPVRAKKQAA